MDQTILAPESGLSATHISLTKGCYVGQEIVARIDSRGQTERSPFRFQPSCMAGVIRISDMSARITPGGARRRRSIAIGAMAQRVIRALRGWAKVPVLPYATLWEASIVASLLTSREFLEPDGYGTEAPFLTDSWPRG